MEIILSVIFLVGIWVYFKVQDVKACNYSQSHQIDWGKINSDRIINDLSNSQVNQNILNGKYNKPVVPVNKNSDETWEDIKRRHPHTENKKTELCGMTKDQMIERMRKINAKHKDNIDSRKNAMKILMSGIPVGNKVFVIVPVEDLHIDDSYQRPVQSHVNTIAREWDDMKCDPLKINYREDGYLYVWDGQHRLVALRIMGVDYVLCVITVGLTQEQEAALFGCQGNGIKKPDPYDIFKERRLILMNCYGMQLWSMYSSKMKARGLNFSCWILSMEIMIHLGKLLMARVDLLHKCIG